MRAKANHPEKPCGVCGNIFKPTGSRSMLCDTCKPGKQILVERLLPARDPWVSKQESLPCRKCGAEPGRQCVTAVGTFAYAPHKARFDDAGGTAETETRNGRQLEWRQRRSRENREHVFAHYGTSCACCGATENLTIDHIDGNGHNDRKKTGTGSYRFYAWLIRNNFPKGFQTLCMLCNMSKMTGEHCQRHDERKVQLKAKTIRIPVDLLAWYEDCAVRTGRSLNVTLAAALADFQALRAASSADIGKRTQGDNNRRPAA